jgi:ribosomal-protein-alanine N-acetyltransferase
MHAEYDLTVELSHVSEPVITCGQLELHHISASDLVTLYEDPGNLSIYNSGQYTNPYRVLIEGHSPVRWRVPQVKANPETNKWFVRWMVLRETREIVGSVSFHGAPDETGMLEIGLGVHENFWRQGIGCEAVMGMWLWAASQPGVLKFRYTVDPNNAASVGLIRKFGFAHVGQQIDEEDGPEDIYEMSVKDFLNLHA